MFGGIHFGKRNCAQSTVNNQVLESHMSHGKLSWLLSLYRSHLAILGNVNEIPLENKKQCSSIRVTGETDTGNSYLASDITAKSVVSFRAYFVLSSLCILLMKQCSQLYADEITMVAD